MDKLKLVKMGKGIYVFWLEGKTAKYVHLLSGQVNIKFLFNIPIQAQCPVEIDGMNGREKRWFYFI
jgi:hypothetical protein